MTEPEQGRGRGKHCGARKRQGEGTCTRPAGWGTEHVGYGTCKLHGGNMRNHRVSAELAIVEDKANVLFGELVEVKPVDNPLDVYAGFAGRVVAWMDVLDQLVRRLSSPTVFSMMTGDQVRGEVELFERAMDRCNTVLSTYAKLNIDERLSRITVEQQQMVVEAIEAALAAANVTGALALEAKRAAARRLRIVA